METTNHYVSVKVPAGEYFIGDPCYCFDDTSWRELLDTCDCFTAPVGTVGGRNVLAFGTKHGDGSYKGTDRFEYSVDSGLIGLIPVEAVTKDPRDLCRRVKFGGEVLCFKADGVLGFHTTKINTAD